MAIPAGNHWNVLTRSGWAVVLAMSGLITAFAWTFLLQDEAAPMASAPPSAAAPPPVEIAPLPIAPPPARPASVIAARTAPLTAPRPVPRPVPEAAPAPETVTMAETAAQPMAVPEPQPAQEPDAAPMVPEPAPAEPALVQLTPEERAWMLADMRKFLASSREIMELAIDEDFVAAEQLARSLGPAYATRDPALLARLPSDFRARDRAMRDDFDALADFIAATPDTTRVIEAVNAITPGCSACHDAYRLERDGEQEREPNGEGTRAPDSTLAR